jgi:hypothetical protein
MVKRDDGLLPRERDRPTDGQTEKSIGEFLNASKEDDEVAIHETYHGVLRFTLTKIENIAPKKGRLYTVDEGYGGSGWYIRTGRSTRYPTGQSHLVEPTAAIREFIAKHSDGVAFMYKTARLYGTD